MRVRRSAYSKKEKKKLKKRKYKKSLADNRRFVSHPLFGEIPMIEKTTIGFNGKKNKTWGYDPDYKPKLPKNAVAGNIREQMFCHMCHTPKYFYVDIERECVQCNQLFVFSAKEQKYWYETLKFNFHSSAIRCVSCRRKQRSDKSANG